MTVAGVVRSARAGWARASTARRLRLVVALTVLAAAVAIAVHAQRVTLQPLPPVELLLLVAVAVPLSESALLRLRFGSDHLTFTWGEAAVLLALAWLPLPWVALLAGATCTAVHLIAHRGPQKAAFNGASTVLGVTLAGVVLGVLTDGGPQAHELSDLGALVLAGLSYSTASALLTSRVVSVASNRRMREVLRGAGLMFLLVGLGNAAVASGVLLLSQRSPATLVVIPPLLLAVFLTYRGYLSAMQERDVWRQLEAASRELNLLDELDVAGAALRRATHLFRPDTVELVLHATPERAGRTYLLDGPRVLRRPFDLAGTDPVSTTYVEVGRAEAPVRTCLVAPLEGQRGRIGTLRLLFTGEVRLSARERQVLSTFAHAVSTTLLNVALHDDVRAEATRHAHEANHDPLTGLANRSLLHDRTAAALSADDGSTTALLLLDLDHFKEINDTLGHAAGDVLLQQVARRLKVFVADGDVVARLGGDEFAVLLPGLSGPEGASPVADALLRLLSTPVEFEGLRLSIEGSVGVACHPQDATSAEDLFRRADVAMYQAKSSRGSWLRYSVERDDSSVHRQALVAELRAALEGDQIVVHYQPQVDLETGLVVGAEALCRWEHPTRGLLAPGEFVAVAEQSGLVRPFTIRVLDQAVARCTTWQEVGRPMSVAVNLSARSLLDRQLPDDVAAVLARHGLPPDRLVLEITETTATSELEVVEDVLGRLRRLGVEISVDDFGTGYSSLAFLQRTAVNELKVDRSFVAGMLDSENDLALVRATVQLAHSLGARSVAEGVEQAAMAVALREMGCDVAQGFWLSEAVSGDELEQLLRVRLGVPGLVPRLPSPRSESRLLQVAAEGA